MGHKDAKTINQQNQKLPLCEFDFQSIDGDQGEHCKSVCVYSTTCSDLSRIFKKYEKIEPIEGGSAVTFSKASRAQKAVSKYHGKEEIIVCQGFAPPLIAQGRNPDVLVLRNVPKEITVPQLWEFLNADENQVSHMSILPTSSRDVLILCRDDEGKKQLLDKDGTKLKKWTVNILLWYEFCASVIKNVLVVENLPEGTTVETLKNLLGVTDEGTEYIQIKDAYRFALIVCKSKSILQQIANSESDELNFSRLKHINYGIQTDAPLTTVKRPNCVYLTNLHKAARPIDLCLMFQDCGYIESIHVPRKQTADLKEAGVITFRESASVEAALAKTSNLKIRTTRVTVHRYDPFDDKNNNKKRKTHKGSPSPKKKPKLAQNGN